MSLFNLLLNSVIDRLPSEQIAAHSVNTVANIHSSRRQNMVRHLAAWGALVFLMLGGRSVYAQTNCVQYIGLTTFTVPSDAKPGDVLKTYNSAINTSGTTCTMTLVWATNMSPTNIPGVVRDAGGKMAPGIGLRLTVHATTGDLNLSFIPLSASVNTQRSAYTLQVVRLNGNLGPGPLFPNPLVMLFDQNSGFYALGFDGGGGGAIVIPPTCSVTAPSIMVPMGNVPVSAFKGGVGSSSPPTNPFNISLTCAGGDGSTAVSIYTTLTDATKPANRTDTLTLTSNSQATGVGIQILKSGTPLKYGPDSSASGNTNQWLAGSATANGQFNIPLTARYIQTLPAITLGSANAIATFTMNYR
jgi:type 1 fimbria pilin